MEKQLATFEDFSRLDIRVGTILTAQPFPKARRPAYQLTVDFGPEIGVKSPRRKSPTTTARRTCRAYRCWGWSTSRPGRSRIL